MISKHKKSTSAAEQSMERSSYFRTFIQQCKNLKSLVQNKFKSNKTPQNEELDQPKQDFLNNNFIFDKFLKQYEKEEDSGINNDEKTFSIHDIT